MDIKKKPIVTILGSSSEIGLSLAKKYYEKNCELNLSYRGKKNKEKIINKLNIFNEKEKVKLFELDILKEKNILKFIKKNKKILEKTNILILTFAEQGQIDNFFKLNTKKFYKTLYINFFSYVIFFQNLSTIFKKKTKKLIILFSGGGSVSYRKNFFPYSLSKLCLIKLTEILNQEIQNKHIRFNILSPGIIFSNMTKKVLKCKDKISKEEYKKLKLNLKNSQKNINKIYDTINFLYSPKGDKIRGKIISSAWDGILKFKKNKIKRLINSNIYTISRKEFN